MARPFRLTKPHLLILARLAGCPGCSYLELVNGKAYLTINSGIEGWVYVNRRAAEELIAQGYVEPGSAATCYQVTPAGHAAALEACKPILKRIIAASDVGYLSTQFYLENKTDCTILERFGWLDKLALDADRYYQTTYRAEKIAEGAEMLPPNFNEGRWRREQARAKRYNDIAVIKNRLAEAERMVVEKACAAYKQECSFDDLEAAVNALETLRADLVKLQVQEAA